MFPARLNIGLMVFFGQLFLYTLRANISINLLAMVNETPRYDGDSGDLLEQADYGPRNNWTTYEQSLVLGAYFWGNTLTSIPNGLLIDKYDWAKNSIGSAFVVAIIVTAIAPMAAASLLATIALRFILGMVTSGFGPANNRLIAHWSPPDEKGKFVAALFGTDIGTVITWSICGVLIEHFGWKWAFYVPAIACTLFTMLWMYIVHDSPTQHPRITPQERDYIADSQRGVTAVASDDGKHTTWPPIGDILTCAPFWSLLLLQFGHMWGMFFLLNAAPMFLNTVLGFDLASTGFLSSSPYLLRLVTGLMFGALGDVIKSRGWLKTATVRKAGTIFSHIIPGLLIAAIPFLGDHPYACVACITVSFGFNGAASLTNYQNAQDLSPNYVGTVYALMNAAATSAGILSPLVVAHFTQNGNSIVEWTRVFVIGAIVYIVPSLVFMLIGSAKIQPWNEPKKKIATKI